MSSAVRNRRILGAINIKNGKGLELGPLTAPIVLKKDANVYYVDHFSQADLRKKYAGEPVELDKIAPVDFVLGDKLLSQVVKSQKFSFVVASHVIEHIPDMVSWLGDIAKVLEDGGVVSLVIPDKRYTFDIDRAPSQPADIIGAYLDQHTRASSAAMFDFAVNYRKDAVPTAIWTSPLDEPSRLLHRYTKHEALEMCRQNLDPKTYVDSHVFVFTLYHFVEILRTLITLDLLDYELASFEDTHRNEMEFYVSLRKSTTSRARKLASLPKLERPPSPLELHRKLAELEKRARTVEHSRSWKITKPLRAAASIKRALKQRSSGGR